LSRRGLFSLFVSGLPGFRCRRDELQRSSTAIFFALFEVPFDVSHLIRNVGKADNRLGAGTGESVKGCGLHLHGKNVETFRLIYRVLGFPEWRIRGPRRPSVHWLGKIGEGAIKDAQ
jgi:hypothetical protein